ncbi:molybdenum cofactor guanylyltransferase [Campylobacter sp.]|uniref:molybdenum cofactor guanylyltransferase n=1 Tax=Campylobacter sp. TaxID=205 RepID=UPI002AA60549|nr:NTP transferase domain-containing protein [Campylobacter sp.]MCI7075705.1 NTP transferase domain-containing protein [Campylobacter sp.]
MPNMNLKNYNALILAGGKSSRFGSDKTTEPFGEFASITHFLYERLSRVFGSVKVCAKTAKFSAPLPLLIDDFSEFAPIFVLSCLDKNFSKPVFILPADMPFITEAEIFALFKSLKDFDICYAKDSEKEHFLCGFFRPSIATKAREQIAAGELAIHKLLNLCYSTSVEFERDFLNINYKDDFKKALKLAKEF